MCKNFLGDHNAPTYKKEIQILLKANRRLGCGMPLKIYFIHWHLYFCPENLDVVSDDE